MSTFLDGLLEVPAQTDVEQWRAQIEQKRELAATRRSREMAGRLADSTPPRRPNVPTKPATPVTPAKPVAPPRAQIKAPAPVATATARQTTAERIMTLWRNGVTDVDEIAAQTSRTAGTVRHHLRRASISPRRRPRAAATTAPKPPSQSRIRSQALADRIVELYGGGELGHRAIGEILNCSSSTVAFHLKKRGIQPLRARGHRLTKPTGSRPKEYDPSLIDLVRRLAAQELTQPEIAARTRTSRKVVYNVMRRHQIPAGPALARAPQDHAAGLKELMKDAHVSTHQVRTWARQSGVPIADRGLPPRPVLEAYLAAHSASTT